MLINALSFIARVGGIMLLLCLCRSLAEPLMEAAFSGGLPATGWVILIYLVLIGTACALVLPLTAVVIVISLICSASDIVKRHLNLILRDVAALRCGR